MSDDFTLSSQQYRDLLKELKDAEQYGKQADADLFETRRWLTNAERILDNLGYRRCDVPACNCNSYHAYGHSDKR